MIRKLALVAVAAGWLAAPAAANDSTASMGAGGLVLRRTDGIAMLSEDLYLSAREVRVAYRFLNHTDQDIETIVAFPMPDIEPGYHGDMGGRLEDPAHLVPFITWVGDRAVRTEVEFKAVLNGVDVTDRLRAAGLPLGPHAQATWDAVHALPEAVRRDLIADGLLDAGQEPDVSSDVILPAWTLKTTHYWTQWFPAGEEVGITHLYAPAIGGSAGTLVGEPEADFPEAMADYRNDYCLDDAVIQAVTRRRAAGTYFFETWLDYILTTGANWSGPIRDFRLVVDKGSPDNLVSFCAEGVRRIGPTQFEVRHTDYVPARDLNVLILEGVPSPD